ncbi:MAG: hypothetical protein WD336_04825, partial [Trueperaceae bacterium]
MPMRSPPSRAALLRAVKRHVWNDRWTFRGACALGLESLLAEEIGEIVPEAERSELHVDPGVVTWQAPFDAVYAL